MTKKWDHEKPEDIVGKTIERCEEWLMSDGPCSPPCHCGYFIKFTDGTRQFLGAMAPFDGIIPPGSMVMRNFRWFFTDEEIAKAEREEDELMQQWRESQRGIKRLQYERLKEELGI